MSLTIVFIHVHITKCSISLKKRAQMDAQMRQECAKMETNRFPRRHIFELNLSCRGLLGFHLKRTKLRKFTFLEIFAFSKMIPKYRLQLIMVSLILIHPSQLKVFDENCPSLTERISSAKIIQGIF